MAGKLTYLFSFILVVGCISSCSSDDSREFTSMQLGSEVRFDVATQTRASVTSTSDLIVSGSKFVVFGDMMFPGNEEKEPLVILNNTVVEYQNGSWNYEGTCYWFEEWNHSFVAIHPSSICETNTAMYSHSKLSFTYEIPIENGNIVSKENLVDIIAATHRRVHKSDETITPVSFSFGHLMSLINFSPAFEDNVLNESDYIEFHGLELSGFNTQATFHISPAFLQANNQTDDRVIDVTGQDGEGHLIFEFAEPVKVENNSEHVRLFADNEAILMLPQTFDDDSEAKIVLTYTLNGNPTRKQASLPLKNVAWGVGKSYTYKFSINRTGLVASNTVIDDWDQLNAGNFDAH